MIGELAVVTVHGFEAVAIDSGAQQAPRPLGSLARELERGPTGATRGFAVVAAMTFDGADSCPSRSAAAVALVPAEQQCDETLRGGRTQLDVDGAVAGDRF